MMPLLRKALRLTFAGYFCFGNWSCTPDYSNLLTSPQDLPPSIFVFLNTAADSQYVILRNATPASGDYKDFLEKEYQFFRQAQVTLSNGNENFKFDDHYELISAFHEDFEHDFVFVSAQHPQAGAGYALRVEIPQKGVYTAATTAPGDFEILSHRAHDTLNVSEPAIVRWSASLGAAGYRVGLHGIVIDSSNFKTGWSDKIDTVNWKQQLYVEPNAERVATIEHNLDSFYRLHRGTLMSEATIFVEALDSPAWLSRDLNRRSSFQYGGPDEVRTMPGSYSNIANGRGLMSAVTTKTIPVILPAQKR